VILLGGFILGNRYFSSRYPGGSQLLPDWVRAQAMLLDGRDPYSEAVLLEVQRQAEGYSVGLTRDQAELRTPLYATLLYFPLALFNDFVQARVAWMTVLEVGLVSLTLINLRLTNWNPRTWLLAIYLAFSLLWFHALIPLVTGNAAILVGFFLVACFISIKEGWDEIAGVFLGLATIKPGMVALLIAFVVLWSLSKRRWRILVWLVITLVVLSAIMAVFVPDWPLRYLLIGVQDIKIFPPGSIGGFLETQFPAAGARIGWGFSILLGVLLLIEWYACRRKDFRWFLWTASLTLVVNQWIGFQTGPGNFIVLSTALALVFSVSSQRWGERGRVGILIGILTLFLGLWALFLRLLIVGGRFRPDQVMLFPLPLLLLIGLYWVRWWAINPAVLPLEELRGVDSL
jgi:hypothetical protein